MLTLDLVAKIEQITGEEGIMEGNIEQHR